MTYFTAHVSAQRKPHFMPLLERILTLKFSTQAHQRGICGGAP